MTYVDFSAVPEHQLKIHARLENWGRWCHGTGHAQMSPMFRLYRSSQARTLYVDVKVPVDSEDAAVVSKGVVALPEEYRHALNWYYVNRGSPKRACLIIGCDKSTLAMYVIQGRQMMISKHI
jgi:hypothetical protein